MKSNLKLVVNNNFEYSKKKFFFERNELKIILIQSNEILFKIALNSFKVEIRA